MPSIPHVPDSLFDRLPKSTPIPKSPLRYPGGKFRALKTILRLIPGSIQELGSPFFGGGSVEIACAFLGLRIRGYDNFGELVNFWQCVLSDAAAVAGRAAQYLPINREKFYELQQQTFSEPIDQAVQLYVLNRASFSGTIFMGRYSDKTGRFTESAVNYLRSFHVPCLSVERGDFRETIPRMHQFLYVDPPYWIEQKLYGKSQKMQTEFDHLALADLLRQRGQWVLSYNDCPQIRDLYQGYCFLPVGWNYGMNRSKTSNEILIVSPDIQAHLVDIEE